jgi:hypothetical protein
MPTADLDSAAGKEARPNGELGRCPTMALGEKSVGFFARPSGIELTMVKAGISAGFTIRRRRSQEPAALGGRAEIGSRKGCNPMEEHTDAVIERARVREVAGVFRSPDALDAAVAGLLLSGFDRTDVDLMGKLEVLRRRLGIDHVPVEKLADLPAGPRKPYLGSGDLAATLSTLAGILIFVGAAGAALLVVASGGSWWRSVAAA